jgi:hypothetical protein
MVSSLRRSAMRASADRLWPLLAVVSVLTLAACGPDGQPGVNAAQPRGATVAFDSIDGPPTAHFTKLVQDLNEEAKARRLAVVSRTEPSAYRVRGYLAVKIAKQHTTVSWLWDVFDQKERRALRITGEETANGRTHHGWNAADDQMLKRIAASSMDQLAAFLTSPDVMANTPAAAPQLPPLAWLGQRDGSPESAGIFRIFTPSPAPTDEYVAETESEPKPVSSTSSVPLPDQRPAGSAAIPAHKPVAVAASDNASAR